MQRINKKIIIGTAQFIDNYGIKKKNIKKFKTFYKKIKKYDNIFLDTSPKYGNAERYIGNKLSKNIKVGSKLISMKNISKINIKKAIRKNLEKSLNNLNKKKINYYLVHDEKDLLDKNKYQIYNELKMLKDENIISKIGVSIYNFKSLKKILTNFKLDIVQVPFNILDRRLLDFYRSNFRLIKNTEIHARSIFLQGLLLNNLYDFKTKNKKTRSLLNTTEKWFNQKNVSRDEVCINFVNSYKFVKYLVLGLDDFDHLVKINKYLKSNKKTYPRNLFSSDVNLINPSNWKI
tara:strand:- start:243 stop:1112 length:870 start_codon:yes stop_codon:yes gene_type:complete